jgi:membrane associated rhomboid family serine protease
MQSVTLYIIILNVLIWLAQIITYPVIDDLFSLDPKMAASGHVYQFVTYMFLHATLVETSAGVTIYPGHIMMNMFVLAIFGYQLEQALGRRKFMFLYLVSGVGSAAFYMFVMPLFTESAAVSLIGASGAIFGVLAAYAFKYPKSWVYILGLIPLPAAFMVVFLLIEETFLGVMSLQPGVANFGHVGGIITGLLIMTFWKLMNREKKFGEHGFEYVWE